MRAKPVSNLKVDNGIVGIIDILGTSKKSDKELEAIMDCLHRATALFTSSKDKVGNLTYFDKSNVFIVGDAAWVSQKDNTNVARFDVVTSVLGISAELFGSGWPHRAILHCGQYQSKNHEMENIPSYLIGKAIIEAVGLERELKTVGITISQSLVNEASKWKTENIFKNIWYSPSIGGQVLVSENGPDNSHFKIWSQYVSKSRLEHPYIAAAHTLIFSPFED